MTCRPADGLPPVPLCTAPEAGYTLTEMLIVVALLGLAAIVAMPSATVADSRKLDLVAAEMASAMRFARSEAMRTGENKGIFHQKDSLRLRVFSLNKNPPPDYQYDVYHPVDKAVYERWFGQQPYAFPGTVTNALKYRATCTRKQAFYFDAKGTPWCTDPANVLLEEFQVTLALGGETRSVTVHGITGRVTVQ